jgi:hypothetical protein
MTYSVVRVDKDGKSYFDDVEAEWHPVLVPGIPLVDMAESVPVTELTPFHLGANWVGDWHPAPRRQFVFVLEGGMEVTSGQAETRRFDAGAMFLVEDTTGDGHQTRSVGSDPCVYVGVACADLG